MVSALEKTRREIRFLGAEDVRRALPMPKAIDAMRLAFAQYSAGEAAVPLRSRLETTHGITLIMPAWMQRNPALAVKVERSRMVVDSRQGCLAEAGDIIQAGNKIDAELGEIINGVAAGRSREDELTFFKSVGLAAQDAVAAAAVLSGAEALSLGTLVAL